jgi:hypothetical protein
MDPLMRYCGRVMMRRWINVVLVAAAGLSSVSLVAQEMKQQAAGYAVTLRLPSEGLIAGEEMQVEFRLEDQRGSQGPQPVRFARVRAAVDMPSMPTMPPFDEIAHDEGVPGEYGAHPTFAHGGEYRLTLTMLAPDQQPAGVSPPSPAPFTVQFRLQVADPRNPPATVGRASIKHFGLQVKPAEPPVAGQLVELNVAVVNHFVPQRQPGGVLKVGDGPSSFARISGRSPTNILTPVNAAPSGCGSRSRLPACTACSPTWPRTTPARRSSWTKSWSRARRRRRRISPRFSRHRHRP